jgi:hypothetical protein
MPPRFSHNKVKKGTSPGKEPNGGSRTHTGVKPPKFKAKPSTHTVQNSPPTASVEAVKQLAKTNTAEADDNANGSASGNDTKFVASPLFPQNDGFNEKYTWVGSPCDVKEREEPLPGDEEDTDEEPVTGDNKDLAPEEQHTPLLPQFPTEVFPTDDGGALANDPEDGAVRDDRSPPFPFGELTDVPPTKKWPDQVIQSSLMGHGVV